jgi:oligoendopeptidase F
LIILQKIAMILQKQLKRKLFRVLKEQAEKRKEALGLAVLKPWDMEVSTSGKAALKPFNNAQELIDKSITCFNAINPSLGQKLAVMKANKLI